MSKLTRGPLVLSPLGWLGRKTSTQTNWSCISYLSIKVGKKLKLKLWKKIQKKKKKKKIKKHKKFQDYKSTRISSDHKQNAHKVPTTVCTFIVLEHEKNLC